MLNIRGPFFANRALFCIRRIGGPHQLAQIGDSILFLQCQHHNRPTGHEVSKRIEESFPRVDRIKLFRLALGNLQHLHAQDVKVVFLKLLNNVSDATLANRVRFNDGKSALQSLHAGVCPWSFVVCKNLRSGGVPRAAARVSPIAAGDFATRIPADSKALIFSAAVPLPPEMMAPAWPMRRPGGAVWPAMNPTTGFFM